MTNNMAIGPALVIGGNKVEMTQKGKIQVTNSQGKVNTLSQDEFKKQLIKNADNIQAGKDFEFKKDNKNAKAAVGVAGLLAAAYIGLSVAVGKKALTKAVPKAGEKLGFMGSVKNVFVAIGESGVKLWNSIAGKATKVKDKISGKSKALQEKRYATYSKEQAANDAHIDFAKNADTINLSKADRKAVMDDAKAAFKDYDPVKFKKSKVLEEAGLTEKQYNAVKEYANSDKKASLTKKRKEVLPNWIQDKESCKRYTNMIEAKFAKIDEQFAKK